MTNSDYNRLDNSISSFEFIKKASEQYWESVEPALCWGFQIQQGSKWKAGLSDADLVYFQNQVGIKFSDSLKNFYRSMNGLDKPGINNNGGESEITFGPTFYSYPDNIEEIKSVIDWVLEENKVTTADINQLNAAQIFPYYGHRFLILDNEELVLSMYGSDIIFWASNLTKGIAKEIFPFHAINVDTKSVNINSFWNKKALQLDKINNRF